MSGSYPDCCSASPELPHPCSAQHSTNEPTRTCSCSPSPCSCSSPPVRWHTHCTDIGTRPHPIAKGPTANQQPIAVDTATVIKVILAGSMVGILAGFFGVGGGFVIVPALVLALGFTMPEAIGTSLLVIVINSIVALSSRLDGGNIDWAVIVPFGIASLSGVLVGGRIANRLEPDKLQRWFIVLLVAVAVDTAIRSTIALT